MKVKDTGVPAPQVNEGHSVKEKIPSCESKNQPQKGGEQESIHFVQKGGGKRMPKQAKDRGERLFKKIDEACKQGYVPADLLKELQLNALSIIMRSVRVLERLIR